MLRKLVRRKKPTILSKNPRVPDGFAAKCAKQVGTNSNTREKSRKKKKKRRRNSKKEEVNGSRNVAGWEDIVAIVMRHLRE